MNASRIAKCLIANLEVMLCFMISLQTVACPASKGNRQMYFLCDKKVFLWLGNSFVNSELQELPFPLDTRPLPPTIRPIRAYIAP